MHLEAGGICPGDLSGRAVRSPLGLQLDHRARSRLHPLVLIAVAGALEGIARLRRRGVTTPMHSGLMTRDGFIHPVTSRWQRILNGRGVPERRHQHDLPIPIPVRARIVWERDGEEALAGVVVATSHVPGQASLVLVHWTGPEPRSMTLGAWLVESDVVRTS